MPSQKTALSCPRCCNIWRYTRSRRRSFIDKVMGKVGYIPMRCQKCNRRKYMRTSFVVQAEG